MQPLLLWQSCTCTAMLSFYLSKEQGDLAKVAERLALSLVTLALIPEGARRNHSVRLNVLAKESKRAAQKPAQQNSVEVHPPPAFSKACCPSSLPLQQDEAAHATPLYSSPVHDKMQYANLDLPPPVLPATDPAVRAESGRSPHRIQTPDPMQSCPAFTAVERGRFSASPSHNSKPGDFGPSPRAHVSLVSAGGAGEAPQGEGKGPSSAEHSPASVARRDVPGRSHGALPPRGVHKQGNLGPLFAADPRYSGLSRAAPPVWGPSGCPRLLPSPEEQSVPQKAPLPCGVGGKGSGGAQAASAHQEWQLMPQQREAVLLGSKPSSPEVPCRSHGQEVCRL
jgi:hypothetical protein